MATATPVAIGVGAVASPPRPPADVVVIEAAPGVIPIRVTDDSRLGGTTGLLGGIGGGTPRPSGNVAGVFLMVDTSCGTPGLLRMGCWGC